MNVSVLFPTRLGFIRPGMVFPLLFVLAVATPLASALAQAPRQPAAPAAPAAPTPKQIGKFNDWTAATYREGNATVCYAFTRGQGGTPVVQGRGPVILSVTHRVGGRDAVALDAGYVYPAGANVTVQVDTTGFEFYTAQRNAFARDGKASVAAFQKGAQAVARGPGPKEGSVTDRFSLSGFSAAYQAINKECPAR
jgi:hypothetical protein